MNLYFKAELANDYSTDGEVDEYLTQLILKARQAGIFFIVAMQRPDGEFLKQHYVTNLCFACLLDVYLKQVF